MAEIKIPFLDEFEERMLSGKKTATARTRKYGEAGDVFEAFGQRFILIEVGQHYLGEVAASFYLEEGFYSPQNFRNCWQRLHPRRNHYSTIVWLHQFSRT